MKNRQLTFTLDYEEEEQLATVLHFLSPFWRSTERKKYLSTGKGQK